ncbi:MAG: cellulose-binding protein [Fibrobacter sp.]|nr:cellulose-binding protein [Fibrobacter sp.]
MKSHTVFFTCLCTLLLARDAYQQNIIKIAPYGNSITQAAGNQQSYRYPLWKKLIDANIAFDFVGSMNSNFGGNPSRPDYKGKKFDMDHEGHWGWRADEILGKMDTWLQNYTPDMVLMHIGTNDCIQGQDNNGTIGEITQIVGKLRKDNPKVVIFMANLIPCNASGTPPRINDINPKIKTLANQLNTEASPIIFVDQNTGIQSSDLYDGIHPQASGEEKMAQKWFNAISNYLTATKAQNYAIYSSRVTASGPANRFELVCPQISNKNRELLSPDGVITNLLGKKISVGIKAGKLPDGFYVISKNAEEK